jgi:hypothetical protein
MQKKKKKKEGKYKQCRLGIEGRIRYLMRNSLARQRFHISRVTAQSAPGVNYINHYLWSL